MEKIFTKLLLFLVFLLPATTSVLAQNGVGVPYSFSVGLTGGTNPLAPAGVTFNNVIPTAAQRDDWASLIAPTGATFTCAITSGSTTVTITNTANLTVGNTVTGTGIPAATTITAINPNVSITISAAATATNAAVLLTFGGVALNIPFAGVKYQKFAISTNGWIALFPSTYAALAAPFTTGIPANGLSTWSNGYPIIAPLWEDDSTTLIRWCFQTSNLLYVVWTSKTDKGNAAVAAVTHGVKIDCTTGIISLLYSNTTYTSTTALGGGASIGIAGVCTGDFYSVTPNTSNAGTTATADSATENSTVNIKPGTASPVNGVQYIFTPVNIYDNCSTALDAGTITSTCTNKSWSNIHATTSGSGMACASSEVKDVWVKYTKPAGVTTVKFTTSPPSCGAATGTTIEVFNSCGGASLGCSTTGSTYPTFGELTLNRPCAAETFYVRVTNDGDAIGKFNICAIDAGVSSTTGTTCANPTFICSVPYSYSGTTAGSGNEYTSSNSACASTSLDGNDYVFAYTPSSSGCINIAITMANTAGGLSITDGCPTSVGTNCIGNPVLIGGAYTYNGLSVTAGTTYYIVIDDGNGTNSTFSINVTSGGTAPANDLCGNATSLGSIALGTSCSYTTATTACATFTSGPPTPSCIAASTPPAFIPSISGDVWFTFTASFTGFLQVNTQQSATNTTTNAAMAVYTGSCGALSEYACDYNSGVSGMPSLTISVTSGTTYYVRVWSENPETAGDFKICISSPCVASYTGTTCANPSYICSLPFLYSGTTAGSGNEYDSTNAACHTVLMNGNDYVFAYTPTVSGCINISVTMGGASGGVNIMDGCPTSVGTNCIGDPALSGGTHTFNGLSVTAGTTYYIVIDDGNLSASTFTISVQSGGTAPTYDNCASAQSLGTIPIGTACSYQTFTTACATYAASANAPAPSCILATTPPAFITGISGDVWFTFTPSFTGTLQINTQQSSVNTTTNAAMAIYTGTCGSFTQYACDYNSGANAMPSLTIPVTNGTTYYIRIWSETPETAGNFDLCFSSACSPANDLPCNAVNIPLGGTVTGTNVCAGTTSEPPSVAQCVAGGTVNTVWYKVTVPASGSVRVRTHPLTLTDTQIQGFLFASGCASASSTYTALACNDDGAACSGGFNDFSDYTYSGLTSGATLYIAVDGNGSLTGSFEITAIDGTAGTALPPVNGQDCAAAFQVCNSTSITVADPGWRNNGNICDLATSFSCWGNGERNSVWYQFTADPANSGGTATIAFDVLSLASTDIDFLVWDITNASNPCASLTSITPAACNYAASSASTGLTASAPPYAYSSAITFTGSPRTYLLLLNNFNSAANAGYTLNWNASTGISSSGGTAVWSATVDTNWANPTSPYNAIPTNWGACGVAPSCANDAVIAIPGNGRKCTVSSTLSVKSLTINSGATLRLKAGALLNVCGSLTNNGSLICEPGSTIQFIGNSVATISGSLTGVNAFANLIINKSSGGSVTLQNDIDVSGNFSVPTSTSLFIINAKYMKVGGDFTNNNGNSTFAGCTSSTVEFNGTSNQFFTNTTGALTLYNVKMNKASGKLYLATANSSLILDSIGAGGVLNLTSGVIVTPRTANCQEVNVQENATAAIINHSANSFVDGKLRRKIYAGIGLSLPFNLDFPVGDSLTPGGYNLATLTYNSGTVIPDVLVWFTPWPSLPPPMGPVSSECVIADYSSQQLLNNGYWTFSKASASFNGQYSLSLRNQGYSNQAGNTGFTVVKANINADPILQASWGLIGTCVPASTLNNSQRITINATVAVNPTTGALGTNTLTVPSIAGLYLGMGVSGTGIPANTTVTAISGTTITISNNTTAAVSGSINFGASSVNSLNHLYTTAQNLTPLPIELLSFSAEPNDGKVFCNWETAAEKNNDYFNIERSFDGKEFTKIGRVPGFGPGTTSIIHGYSFIDADKCNELRYYRLKQVDIDGRFSYSKIVAVNCKLSNGEINIYPNPTNGILNYQFVQGTTTSMNVSIIDVTGRILKSDDFIAQKGINTVTTDISDLNSGVYYLRLTNKEEKDNYNTLLAKFFKN